MISSDNLEVSWDECGRKCARLKKWVSLALCWSKHDVLQASRCFTSWTAPSTQWGRNPLRSSLHSGLLNGRNGQTSLLSRYYIVYREMERDKDFAVCWVIPSLTQPLPWQRQKGSGFLPPGRPKKWRENTLEVLEEAVGERIEGNMFEGRSDSKNWLIKHLEVNQNCNF